MTTEMNTLLLLCAVPLILFYFILFTKANVPTGESPSKDISYSTHV